ncbi:MAG: leucine-rich repeat domain-containing protein [Oscillibacter sp.]|nr:leucine-rich repeat domain-containing protein [Oscillibacter sp.]
MKTFTEKRDALLRRREELLAEWARNKAALLKKPKERAGGAADESKPPKRVRITGILGELDAELDRLDRLIAEEARKGPAEGPEEQTETRSIAKEPAEEMERQTAGEAPDSGIAEGREAETSAALKRKTDAVLRRLGELYPDRVIPREMEQEYRGIFRSVTRFSALLGYESWKAFLTASGFTCPADCAPPEEMPVQELRPVPEAPPVQELRPMPEALSIQDFQPMLDALAEKYRDRGKPATFGRLIYQNPEYEEPLRELRSRDREVLGMPLIQYLCETGVLADKDHASIEDRLKEKMENVLRDLEAYYPDHVIPRGISRDHGGLSNRITEVYPLLGYESREAFLEANGYTCHFTSSGSQGGRFIQDFQPMLDALTEKYRDREKPDTFGRLLFENPEYKSPLKTLQKKAQELLGMTLIRHLRSIGVLADTKAAGFAARKKETACITGLLPAAATKLREYYQGLNPKVYGTFDDAVQKLEGLEVGCTRGTPGRFFVERVARGTECRANVEIPQGIAFIKQGAFQNQTGLETLVLPESLTEIHASAFEGCTGLRRVILPAGLKLVEDRAFAGCAALEEVNFQGGCPWVSESAFQGSAYQYTPPEKPEISDSRDFTWTSSFGGVAITGYTGHEERLSIPASIRGFPVYGIFEGAFKGCWSLIEVTMPDTIREIRRNAFTDCVNLQKIHLSNAVPRLFAASFSGCTALREVNIPDRVEALPKGLFKDAPLERVHIGKRLETLDTDSFGGCNRPGGLVEITVDPENPYFKSGGPCLYSADGRVLYAFFGEGFFRVPEGVEQISPGAFSGLDGLTEVVFPSTLTEIGPKAFSGSSLRRVEFGEAVRAIGDSAFENCGQLSSALFSEGLEKIGDRAFRGCPVRLVVLPSTLQQLGKESFDSLGQDDTVQELRVAPGGPMEADGDGLYQIDGENKTLIRVYGSRFSADWYYGERKASYIVAEGTTAIARGAFENCCGLRSVTLPDSLREIGDRAFYGCAALRGVRLPKGLRSIGAEAFRGTSLRSVQLPTELMSIGTGAFAAGEDRPPSLQNVRVAKKNPCFLVQKDALLQRKEDGSLLLMHAFGKSETVTVPEGVAEIGRLAFYRSAVKEVRLPASVREVAADAFHQCENLSRLRLELPESAPGWAEVYFPELRGYGWNGMREQYLDCIRTSRDGVFDFLTYDSLFPSIQEFKDQVLIATDRLKSSAYLAPLYRDAYLDWLRKNAAGALQTVIEFDDLAGLNTLAELKVFTGENVDGLIELANSARKPEILSYLLNYKNAEIGITETDYEL